jgi:hypothetical protein
MWPAPAPASSTAALVRVLVCTLGGARLVRAVRHELRVLKARSYIAASAAILSAMNAADEPSGTEALTLGRSLTLSALVTFPAATACILGVIYTVGALTRSAELSRAGVPVTVAFPLIPISQELARGIQIFVSLGALILVPILTVSLVLFDVSSIGSQGPEGTSRVDRWLRRNAHRMRVVVPVLLAVVGWILWRPLLLAMSLLAILAVVLILILAAPEGKRDSVFRRGQHVKISPLLSVAAIVLAISVGLVFAELVNPQQLPQTTLVMERGAPITGPFIAFADGNWYIGSPGHQVRAVDARTVRSAFIVASPRRRRPFGESLFQLIRRGD